MADRFRVIPGGTPKTPLPKGPFADLPRGPFADEPKAPKGPVFDPSQPSPVWTPKAGEGKGLHKLTLPLPEGTPPPPGALSLLDVRRATPKLDFANYRPGMNNRALFEAVIDDLRKLFKVHAPLAYSGSGIHARPNGTVAIDEPTMDKYVAPLATPEEKRAMATFVIAHEFFHVYLKHCDVLSFKDRPKDFKIKAYDQYPKVLELQVDYLAAKYVHALGLPAAPIMALFRSDPELKDESENYPSGDLRARTVESAAAPGIRQDLFMNRILDCLAFLDFLAGADFP